MQNVEILNITILNIKLNNFLKNLKSGLIVTPNVDHLIMLQKDREFYTLYQKADHIICDSKLIQLSSQFLGTPITEKISGSDFFPAFYNYHKNNDKVKIFLLGAMDGIAQKASQNINESIGRKIIVDSLSPTYGFEQNEQECIDIINKINNSNATVLAIGVGSPKGEKFISKYRNKLPDIKILMSIGATIDFEAGNIKRAPKWISERGFEWLYRLASEPKRLWKRYLVDDMPFFWLIIKQRIGLYTNPFKVQQKDK